MKNIPSARRAHYLAGVRVFLIMVALVAGMAGCRPTPQYNLTISSTAGGNVTTPGEGTFGYDAGTVTDLVATTDAGYRFVNWTGDVGTIADVNAAATNITVNGNYSITANFVKQYDLTTSSIEGGSVTEPGEGMFTYDAGTVVDLVATHDAGYSFVNWTGDVSTIANVYSATTTVTMNGDYSVTANFEPPVWDSTITLDCHLTVPNELAPLAQYVYLPWIAELEAINGTFGGKFDVNVTYGDSPFDAGASLAALSIGTTDMGMLSPETYHLGGLGYLPWMFPNITSCAYTMYTMLTEGNARWDAYGQLDGVKILINVPLWGSQMWTRAVNVTEPANLTGLKIRTDAVGVQAADVTALGGVPVYLGVSELAAALNTLTINGCFFTYFGIDSAFGLGGATCYTTELNMFYKPYALAMNKESYDDLPSEARAALDTLCGPAKSVEWASANLAAEAGYRAATDANRPIYVPASGEMDLWKAATANIDDSWAVYMTTTLGYNGTGILARAIELIALSP